MVLNPWYLTMKRAARIAAKPRLARRFAQERTRSDLDSSNCGQLVRSRHAVPGLRNATDLVPGLLLNPYGWLVLAVVVATYIGMGSAIAAVIAAIAAGMIALVLIPIAFPLQIVAPEDRNSRIPQHPRLAVIRAGVLLLAWIGVVVLSGILLVRVFAAIV
jgi:hypothetical protein